MSKEHNSHDYDQLSDGMRSVVSREEWVRRVDEALRLRAERRKPKVKPPDYKEPTITLEQAAADPFEREIAAKMRELGVTVLTRSEYLEMKYGRPSPRPWTVEMDN